HSTLFDATTELLHVFQFLVYGYYIIQRTFKGVWDDERDAGIFIRIDMIIVEFIFYMFLRSMLVHHIHPRLILEDDVCAVKLAHNLKVGKLLLHSFFPGAFLNLFLLRE